MTDDDINEAIEVLARACNTEHRQDVIQTLRKIVNSGGELTCLVQSGLRCASPSAENRPAVHPITANYVLSDKREACSSCGLTMGESTLLHAIKQNAENRGASGDGSIPEGQIIDAIKKACGEYRTGASYDFEDVWNCIEAFTQAAPPSQAENRGEDDELMRLREENAELAAFVIAVGGFWDNSKSNLTDGETSLAACINRAFKEAAQDDVWDAQRYRLFAELMEQPTGDWPEGILYARDKKQLDSAIDAAIASQSAKEPR